MHAQCMPQHARLYFPPSCSAAGAGSGRYRAAYAEDVWHSLQSTDSAPDCTNVPVSAHVLLQPGGLTVLLTSEGHGSFLPS